MHELESMPLHLATDNKSVTSPNSPAHGSHAGSRAARIKKIWQRRHKCKSFDDASSNDVQTNDLSYANAKSNSHAVFDGLRCSPLTTQGLKSKVKSSQDVIIALELGKNLMGIELAADVTKGSVFVKNIHNKHSCNSHACSILTRGSTLVKIDARDVSHLNALGILRSIQTAPRPLLLSFQVNESHCVTCKLCEEKVLVKKLDGHTKNCIILKQNELFVESIDSRLLKFLADTSKTEVDHSLMDVHTALHETATQSLHCDAGDFESVERFYQLLKRLSTIYSKVLLAGSDQSIAVLRQLREFVSAKLSSIRIIQKIMLLENATEGNASYNRTSILKRETIKSSRGRRSSTCLVSIRDFKILKPISRGAYGEVYLASKRTTGDLFAIKVLAKENLLRKKQIHHIATERDILMNLASPFVVKLYWTFQTRKNLFLVMEYLPGGDLMSLLDSVIQLDERVARVYIAQIALALNHLHKKGFVHRDLKPDNILISATGHVKLTDFGLSEEGIGISQVDPNNGIAIENEEELGDSGFSTGEGSSSTKSKCKSDHISRQKEPLLNEKVTTETNNRCGTPDYLSPEIILEQVHDAAVDYWALGVILYEMLVGFPPFNDQTVESIFDNILNSRITWPDGEKQLSSEASNLISQLLDPNPLTRIGWQGLSSHPFFQSLDWDTILDITPPFVPTLEGPSDTSYFNNRNLTDTFIDDEDGLLMVENDIQAALTTQGHRYNANLKKCDKAHQKYGLKDEQRHISANAMTPHTTSCSLGNDQSAEGTIRCPHTFPSGMYSFNDLVSNSGGFESFSVTNLNALAAASRNDANLLAKKELSEMGPLYSYSIVI